jgi:hypothetical protein
MDILQQFFIFLQMSILEALESVSLLPVFGSTYTRIHQQVDGFQSQHYRKFS